MAVPVPADVLGLTVVWIICLRFYVIQNNYYLQYRVKNKRKRQKERLAIFKKETNVSDIIGKVTYACISKQQRNTKGWMQSLLTDRETNGLDIICNGSDYISMLEYIIKHR